jgi:photosystem II stability/assembly factor-like uncharacterized protein
MKKGWTRTECIRWIAILLLICLISACGIQEPVETLQTDEGSESAIPTSTPTITNTPSSLPTYTLTPEPTATGIPVVVPHFTPGESLTITSIDMTDGMNGWAIAEDKAHAIDHILTTSNSGSTWHDVTPDEPPLQEINEFTYKHAYLSSLDGEHASVIYDAGEYGDPARVWSTSSAGNTWDVLIIDTNFQVVDALTFTDESHGWLLLGVDAGMGHQWIDLYQINVDRQEWDLLIDPNSEDSADLDYCCKTGMVFTGSDTGLVTFGRGPMGGAFIDWTDDGGLTWESHPLPRPVGAFEELGDADYGILCESHSPTLFSPQFARVALECWTDLDASDIISFIFTTTDGGNHWDSSSYPGGELVFLSPEVGWALSKAIYRTLDGGQTWTTMDTVQWEGQFSFISQTLGWAAARDGEAYAIVRTEDGGKTWDVIEAIATE